MCCVAASQGSIDNVTLRASVAASPPGPTTQQWGCRPASSTRNASTNSSTDTGASAHSGGNTRMTGMSAARAATGAITTATSAMIPLRRADGIEGRRQCNVYRR